MRGIAITNFTMVTFVSVGLLLAGQTQDRPAPSEPPVILENEYVRVQRATFGSGDWVGEHTHPRGRYLIVILKDHKQILKEGGQETEVTRKAGEVFWVDRYRPVTHDHKTLEGGEILIVALK